MTATRVELLPPRSRRSDIVAAYSVTARYLEPPETLQEELHFELAEVPAAYAPQELFRDLASELPWSCDGDRNP